MKKNRWLGLLWIMVSAVVSLTALILLVQWLLY